MNVDDLLLREERWIGNPCRLVRFWETDVNDYKGESHGLSVVIYEHGYASPDLAHLRPLRFAVYDGDRHIAGGIVA